MADGFARGALSLGRTPKGQLILREVCRLTGMGFVAVARVSEER